MNNTIKWPAVGTSVMLNATPESKDSEWVDSYVVKNLDNGVVVKTFWGDEVTVTDPSRLEPVPANEAKSFDFGNDDYELGN